MEALLAIAAVATIIMGVLAVVDAVQTRRRAAKKRRKR